MPMTKVYADLDALKAAVARKRNPGLAKIRNADGLTCAACGIGMTDPYVVNPGYGDQVRVDTKFFTVHYKPRTKQFAPMHYVCSWGATLSDVFKMADRL